MLFELFYVGFGQFIAALSPNELFASLLVPAFFTFVVAFCGVVVPYVALPYFWQSWMYWLTPFHYLLEGLLGVVVHEEPLRCVPREESRFSLPPGMGCQEYAGGFADRVGGYVSDVEGGLCSFCQYSSGDQFVRFFPFPYHTSWEAQSKCGMLLTMEQAASFNVFYAHKWRNYVRSKITISSLKPS